MNVIKNTEKKIKGGQSCKSHLGQFDSLAVKTADSHLSLLGGLKATQCEVAVFTGYQFGCFLGENKGISG